MTIKELREKTEKELQDLLLTLRDTERTLRFRIAAKEVKSVREVRETKKSIARILTLLSSKSAIRASAEK